MDEVLDFWNLMAYDYAGSWHGVTAHQANLFPCSKCPECTPFSTAAAVHYYKCHGVAGDKIVIGMPLYGRAFENTDGMGRPYSGVGEGNWENGIFDFKNLPLPGFVEQADADVCGGYCQDAQKRKIVTYDTVEVARRKAEYIRNEGLGGAMWWESSADKTGPESLIGNVLDALGGPGALQHQQNCIAYPQSKYDNLRNGFPNSAC